MKKRLTILLFLLLNNLLANEVTEDEYQYYFHYGKGYGGSTIYSIPIADGSSDELLSNDGVFMLLGFKVPIFEGLQLHILAGYQHDEIVPSAGTASFSFIPISVRVAYDLIDYHRVFIGINYNVDISSSCNVTGSCNETYAYDNAVGGIIGFEYLLLTLRNLEEIFIGISYQNISYHQSVTNVEIDGSGYGIYVGFSF